MSFPTYVPTFASGASEARRALFVVCVTAHQQIADNFTARSFTRQLGLSRLTANEPAVVARSLSGWISHNG
jgi:hypothetical protein